MHEFYKHTIEILKVIWEIIGIIGLLFILFKTYDLVNYTGQYMKQKNHDIRNKKVCDTCFEQLKQLVSHARGETE